MTELYQRIAGQAAHRPDALALQVGERLLSYRDLLDLTDASARQFRAEGLGQASLLGWLGHNSAEMMAALLACAKIGAVFVPGIIAGVTYWLLALVAKVPAAMEVTGLVRRKLGN